MFINCLIVPILALGIHLGQCATQSINDGLSVPIATDISAIGDKQLKIDLEITPVVTYLGTRFVAANKPIHVQTNVAAVANQSLLHYNWSTKAGPVKTDGHAAAIDYKFTKPDEETFIQVDVFDPGTNHSGQSRTDFIVKEELVVKDPVGKTFLEKGELLKINLVYSGSPPFTYCYKFCSESHDLIPCFPHLCFPPSETTNTTIPIVQYLHWVDNYTLIFQIENIMNSEERQFAVKIIDTNRPRSNLPIEPIISSILAVCILITGVALHMRFKDTSYTETANFDFFHDDNDEDWERELSLVQRVRQLFCGNDQDEDNETSYLIQNGATRTLQSYSDDKHQLESGSRDEQ